MSDVLPELLRNVETALASGRLPEACSLLGETLRLAGDRPDLLAARGHLLLMLGQVQAAEEAARRAAALDPTHDETLKLLGRLRLHATGPDGLRRLPGSPYARYALPLDYPPSRDLRPRWGYQTPPHPQLSALFARDHAAFEARVNELRSLRPFLERIRSDYSGETAPEAGWVGPPINAIDLALLYYFVWKHRPRTYLEIGSGATTCFARRAARDHGLATRIVSIDPDPRSAIDAICDEVLRDGLETLSDLRIFEALLPGDIVFLDGSHRAFMNSDVTAFFLDVLPRLRPGVLVHIHDIVLPYDYPELFKDWYWNEQYVLGAYLLGARERVQVLMPSKYVSATPGLKECLHPPILPGVGDPTLWTEGGSFWFTHAPGARSDVP